MSNEKDQMVKQGIQQVDNYHAKPSEFPIKGGGGGKSVGGQEAGGHGSSQGHNEMTKASCSPRHLQDGGPGASGAGTPSIWGHEASIGPIEKNNGEGGSDGLSSISTPETVDFVSGKIRVAGYSETPVHETPEKNTPIPPRN